MRKHIHTLDFTAVLRARIVCGCLMDYIYYEYKKKTWGFELQAAATLDAVSSVLRRVRIEASGALCNMYGVTPGVVVDEHNVHINDDGSLCLSEQSSTLLLQRGASDVRVVVSDSVLIFTFHHTLAGDVRVLMKKCTMPVAGAPQAADMCCFIQLVVMTSILIVCAAPAATYMWNFGYVLF